jgi:CelD/BcsL family acetyltransferase involved in cellulose biosynthesis
MAEAAPGLGLQVIDLGKGDSMYKQRLASGSTLLAEGCVEAPSLVGTLRKLRRGAEDWAENTPLEGISKLPGRVIRRLERNSRFR